MIKSIILVIILFVIVNTDYFLKIISDIKVNQFFIQCLTMTFGFAIGIFLINQNML